MACALFFVAGDGGGHRRRLPAESSAEGAEAGQVLQDQEGDSSLTGGCICS